MNKSIEDISFDESNDCSVKPVDVSELINNRNFMQDTRLNLIEEIKRLDERIKKTEKIIYKHCTHNWVYDPSSYMDRTKYFCKDCKLWRNDCWYN